MTGSAHSEATARAERWSVRRTTALDRLFVMLVATAGVLVALHQIVAFDIWWQLAAGSWIVENGLPTVDPFSFAEGTREWIELRWLGFVGASMLVDAFGLNALIVAKIVVLTLTFAALWLAMGGAPVWVRAAALLCALMLMLTRFKVRPELFTFLFLAGFLAVVERHRRGASSRWLWALPAMQLVWSNTHTLWILGLAVAWAAWVAEAAPARFPTRFRRFDDPEAVDEEGRRALLRAAIATTVAGFVTPYLLAGQFFPLTLMEQLGVGDELRQVISELRSPLAFVGDPLFFVPYVGVAVLSGASFALPGASFPLLRVGAWSGALAFSFLSARNVSLFGLVAAWTLALQVESWWRARGDAPGPLEILLPPTVRGVGIALACALMFATVTDWLWRSRGWEQRFGTGVATVMFPIEAMSFVDEHALPRPVLASLGDGSYLIFEGGERSVYVDGRLEVYGADGILESSLDYANPPKLFEIVDRLGIDSVLIAFPLMRVALDAFESSPDWAPVYYDAGRVLYLRRSERTAEAIARLEIDWQAPLRRRAPLPARTNPPDWLSAAPRLPDLREGMGVGTLLLQMGSLDAAEEQLGAVLVEAPEYAEAHGLLGILLWAREARDQGQVHLARAPAGWLTRTDVLETRARLASLRGAREQLFDFAAMAIASGSRSGWVRRSLFETARELGREDRAARVLQTTAEEAADDPASALLLGDLGALAQSRGLWGDALRHYRAGLELDPQRASLWASAAACHAALGDAEAARAARERARALRAEP